MSNPVNWTEDMIKFVIENAETMPWKQMVRELGLNSQTPLTYLRKKLNIRRSADANEKIIDDSKFQKGNKPVFSWPKGHRVNPATEFRKGNLPANTLHDGAITLRHHVGKKEYYFIRTSQGRWALYHRHIWEKVNGKIPSGYIVVFKNGDSADVRIENLEMISRKDNVRRNHNPAKTGIAMKKYWAENHHLSHDNYIVHTIAYKDPELQKELLLHPEIIELKRTSLILKRKIKNEIAKNA